ncbi:hypothetical protein [Shewanella psychromarinicola]|uniref:AbiV family abortive infection protein n=1 Tax=Shewanella psychromarinicola TaxID=2487742 RepID=A0A3N4EDR4_9GAMM|nr:hypothetical protein [Shewanella psychromarinicola]AZG33531.1 hypothetical protein EGC80_00345 [Shewanella psychromarinicola]MCL1084306.1 hypothetical protein [Shewanella psychromarinicola]RPA27774.1 hypothetical protein EGC77_16195 [Shewanella psychromarinicola]
MNKLEIAPNMLYRAAKSYIEAQDDFDYIQAILLAGSAMYICEPLLEEQGLPTQARERADRIIKLREACVKMDNNKLKITWDAKLFTERNKEHIRCVSRVEDRKVYNALKHSGIFGFDKKTRTRYTKKKASDDLEMIDILGENLDFRTAAEDIIIDAIQDYKNLDFNGKFKPYNLGIEIRRVLDCIYLEDAF